MMKKASLFLAVLLAGSLFLQAQSIEEDSSKVVIHAYHGDGGEVEGLIRGMSGEVQFDPMKPAEARFQVCIDPATIETGIKFRDMHLRGGQFLKVKKFPAICFESTKVEVSGDAYQVWGTLTIKETSREISFPFSYEEGVLRGSIELNRFDYGVDYKNEKRVAPQVQAHIYCVLAD